MVPLNESAHIKSEHIDMEQVFSHSCRCYDRIPDKDPTLLLRTPLTATVISSHHGIFPGVSYGCISSGIGAPSGGRRL